MAKGKIVEFVDEGVRVIFPKDKHVGVYVQREALQKKAQGNNFHPNPNRHIIQIIFFKLSNSKFDKMIEFKDEFFIEVGYKQADINFAVKKNDMKLGIHDGKKWKPYEKDTRGWVDKPGKEPWKGYGRVTINNWQDPVIAWGK